MGTGYMVVAAVVGGVAVALVLFGTHASDRMREGAGGRCAGCGLLRSSCTCLSSGRGR